MRSSQTKNGSIIPGDLVLYIGPGGDKMWGIVGKQQTTLSAEDYYDVFWSRGLLYPYSVGRITEWKCEAANV